MTVDCASDDPLEGLSEPERLALAVRFGRVRMCAALSHGHSFEQSIFKLPAKCAGCQEVVWGPFNRGCTCLTCKLTAHRACTGLKSMPPCPTKSLFKDFCHSGLSLKRPHPAAAAAAAAAAPAAAGMDAGHNKCPTNGSYPGETPQLAVTGDADHEDRIGAGGSVAGADLSEWAEVEGGKNAEEESIGLPARGGRQHSSSPALLCPPPPASSMQEVRDRSSSFSWSPFGGGSGGGGLRKRLLTPNDHSYEKLPTTAASAASGDDASNGDDEATSVSADETTVTSPSVVSGTENSSSEVAEHGSRISSPASTKDAREQEQQQQEQRKEEQRQPSGTERDEVAEFGRDGRSMAGLSGFGKISVAGGVVGAVIAGPAGAMVGLKLGAVLAAGRWSAQGLWQRIEKDRKEAGAEGNVVGGQVATGEAGDGATTAMKTGDVWALIAARVESENKTAKWSLDPEQEERLQQGECDAAEVAMFIVGRILADETALPSRLYCALLAEFHSRHRRCDCGRPTEKRCLCRYPRAKERLPRDTDMVSVFPRAGGSGSRRDRRLVLDGTAERGGEASARGGGSFGSQCGSREHQKESSFFAQTPGLEKTFSFVEEMELVDGEGSDTFVGEDGASSTGEETEEQGARDVYAIDGGSTAVSSDHTHAGSTPIPCEHVVTLVTPIKDGIDPTAGVDSWRNASTRMDSWVELEGVECVNCGGRVAKNGILKGRFVGAFARGGGEDETVESVGLGDNWAATEGPSCWCMDESGFSASPDSSLQSTLHGPRRESLGCKPGGPQGMSAEGGGPALDDASQKSGPGRTEHAAQESVGVGGPDASDPDQRDGSPVAPRRNSGGEMSATEDGGERSEEDEGRREDRAGAGAEACDALRDVHGVLRELTRAVLSSCPRIAASDEATIHAVNCIDQRVFAETYGPVYGHIARGTSVRERDAALERRARADADARQANGQPSLARLCRREVLASFRAAGAARTGRDKLGLLVRGVEEISDALPPQSTTDTLLWSLCRHLAAASIAGSVPAESVAGTALEEDGEEDRSTAALPRPHAEVAFLEQFMRDESWLMGKEGYVLTTVDAALHALLNPEMSDDVFVDAHVENGGNS